MAGQSANRRTGAAADAPPAALCGCGSAGEPGSGPGSRLRPKPVLCRPPAGVFRKHLLALALGAVLYLATAIWVALPLLRRFWPGVRPLNEGIAAHAVGLLPILLCLIFSERLIDPRLSGPYRFRMVLRLICTAAGGAFLVYIQIGLASWPAVLALAVTAGVLLAGHILLSILSYELMLYLIFGALTTVVSIGSFSAASQILARLVSTGAGQGFWWLLPQTISFAVAVLFGFWSNRRYVFCSSGPVRRELVAFFGNRLISSLVLEYGGIFVMVNLLRMAPDTAKIIGAFLVVAVNYFISKFWIFKPIPARHRLPSGGADTSAAEVRMPAADAIPAGQPLPAGGSGAADTVQPSTSLFGPARLRALMGAFGHPEAAVPAVHIAGTNGKGSVAVMTALMAASGGLRVGLFTSPHIRRERERIRLLDGRGGAGLPTPASGEAVQPSEPYALQRWPAVSEYTIRDGALHQLTADIRDRADSLFEPSISYFETLTAAAFCWFRDQACDLLVMETGLGGELDATNILLAPKLAVITAIGRDHCALLGNTLSEIAGAKSGIVTPCTQAVLLYDPDSLAEREADRAGIRRVVAEAAQKQGISVECVGQPEILESEGAGLMLIRMPGWPDVLPVPLPGRHQAANLALAIRTIEHLALLPLKSAPDWAVDAVRRRCAAVLPALSWPGRLTAFPLDPPVFFDGAHNVSAVRSLCRWMDDRYAGSTVDVVIGFMADKDYRGMLGVLLEPHAFTIGTIGCITPAAARALPKETLAQTVSELYTACSKRYNSVNITIFEDLMTAIRHSASGVPVPARAVVVFGSLYLIDTVYRVCGQLAEEEHQFEVERRGPEI